MDNRRTDKDNRQSRSFSPYARPSPAAAAKSPDTPSRFKGLLTSLLTPFRSGAAKNARTGERDAKDGQPAKLEALAPIELDGDDSPDEVAGYVLPSVARGNVSTSDELDNRPPPSPTPAGGRPYPDSFGQLSTPRFPTAGPSSPMTFSPQHLRSATYPSPSPIPIQRTPSRTEQFAKYGTMKASPPGRANQELARFFQEKAEAGDAPLTAFEQAGVYQLLQQAQGEAAIPTAFTPDFSRASTPNSLASNGQSTSPVVPSASPFQRRRPLYVGAGYSPNNSARKRKQQTAYAGEIVSDRPKFEEEVEENGRAGYGTVAEGKRRKMDDDSSVAMTSEVPPPARPVAAAVSALTSQKPTPISIPNRPSPLWQSSKADTPSPSPPKKAVPTPRSTGAAAMMLDIIRQEDASPKNARQAVLNPYEASDDALARVPRSRPARVATPRKAPTLAAPAPAPVKERSPLEILEQTMPSQYKREEVKVATPTPFTFGTSAPSAFAPATPVFAPAPSVFAPTPSAFAAPKRPIAALPVAKPTPPPAPHPAPPKAPEPVKIVPVRAPVKASPPKKVVEVLELSDSSGEEESEEEQVMVKKVVVESESEEDEVEEGEEEEQTEDAAEEEDDEDELDEEDEVDAEDDDEEEDEDDDILIDDAPVTRSPSPEMIRPKASMFSQPSQSNLRRGRAPIPSTPPPKHISRSPSFSTPGSSPQSLAPAPTFFQPKAALPPTPPPAALPFTFAIPTPISSPPILSDAELRQTAILLPVAALPTYAFDDAFVGASQKEDNVVLRGVQDLVMEMSVSELPSITL